MSQSVSHETDTPLEARILAIFAIVVATSVVAGLNGLIAEGNADQWYRELDKAPGTPPGIVFALVWPALDGLMTIGAILAWNGAGSWREADSAMGVYFAQLCANLGWTALFFHLHRPLGALLDLCVLAILAGLMVTEFRRHTRVGAWLQAPYLAWLAFAFYLNLWVVLRNPDSVL